MGERDTAIVLKKGAGIGQQLHLPTVRCILATHFGKDWKLQLWSLCDHFWFERSALSEAWP